MSEIEKHVWQMIETYFRDNSQALVRHHVESYNDFFHHGIQKIFQETNPLRLEVDYNEEAADFASKCHFYFGGKTGDKIYIGKPTIQDPDHPHLMYPNECRLRNMTYGMPIHYEIDVEYEYIADYTLIRKENQFIIDPTVTGPKTQKKLLFKLPKTYLGSFPIMLQSDFCILSGMTREMRFQLGECKNDYGGYFLIDGKEKTIVNQEKFGDNILSFYHHFVDLGVDDEVVDEAQQAKEANEKFSYAVDIRSISENVSKPKRKLSIKIMVPTLRNLFPNIVVAVPDVGAPVPLFILFRALGILTDKEIISFCTFLDPDVNIPPKFAPYLDACIYDASPIMTQTEAIHFIAIFVKGGSVRRTLSILADSFLPHVGEVNFLEKAFHLGYMVNRLLLVATGADSITEKDHFVNKRVELVGPLMRDLFREYFLLEQKKIRLFFETVKEMNQYKYLCQLVLDMHRDAFSKKMVEEGFKKAFKGNWGAQIHTKKVGITQPLERLSHNAMVSHLRKVNLPLDASNKNIAPRVLHPSQWGFIDPIDTPDGASIGLHKHLSVLAYVSPEISREPLMRWLLQENQIHVLALTTPIQQGLLCKVILNGLWIGGVTHPSELIKKVKNYRRFGLLPQTVSISLDAQRNTVLIQCDGGRLCRPLFYKDGENNFPFQFPNWLKEDATWEGIISTTLQSKKPRTGRDISSWSDMYAEKEPTNWDTDYPKAIIEYIDNNETESALIAMDATSTGKYTHCELHASTIYGNMTNLINYLEHNPVTRNSFSCGQSKQACSLYHTNYQLRMDKMAVVLCNGQIPLVKTKYMNMFTREENPYGENAIVAIMCFTGYNVEDAILLNEASLHRGLFRTTYYTTYEAFEEKEEESFGGTTETMRETTFTNVELEVRKKNMTLCTGYDYSKLDDNGLILENTEMTDQLVVIGMTESSKGSEKRSDKSVFPKKGQVGYVDKAFMTDGEEGKRIAKVRIREERIPNLGDKFASRAGQKGTVGMIIPEANMPFTKNGLRPDIIINPHALPSRMTIGQMIETIVGKTCAFQGTFGDCTAFSKTDKLDIFGELLSKHGFHSSGDEIMYDGMSGKQVEASVFVGPTYYMRLKHMVKDKINFRARGPNTNVTRQPVQGRANDGGLRIGEMERDSLIAHGVSSFLQESMMERSDKYQMAICNHTGMIAIYNESKNLLYSPNIDGPIRYANVNSSLANVSVQPLSRFGKSFSLVSVPYSLKVMIQELRAINVNVQLITEDNIDQFQNMATFKNVDLLLHSKDTTPQMVMKEIVKAVRVEKGGKKIEEVRKKISSDVLLEEEEEEEEEEEKEEEESPCEPGSVGNWKGDTKPTREWTVQKRKDNYCTIDTNDLENLDLEKSVKIVRSAELHLPYFPNTSIPPPVPPPVPSEEIQCPACTFLQNPSATACEMCGTPMQKNA